MAFRSGIVAILGRPNVGKSTLLNVLIGEKIAAVTEKPQTTRRMIRGIRHTAQSQLVFLDTPGYHKSRQTLNRWMLEQAKLAAQNADVCVVLIPAPDGWDARDDSLIRLLHQTQKPFLIGISKVDQVAKSGLLPLIERIAAQVGDVPIIPLSAPYGEGLNELVIALEERIPEGAPLYPPDQFTDETLRDLAAEMIRERLFAHAHQEIPYGTAVLIDSYEEPNKPRDITRIHATILVERSSQKGIIIGKGGQFLKKIGTEAREQIERLVGSKIFLSLHVKVAKDWSEDPQKLRELGYV